MKKYQKCENLRKTILGTIFADSALVPRFSLLKEGAKLKEGENIAPPMESTRVFPPMVISMIEVGEETGELPQMLGRIADNYEDEVDNTVAGITSVIEPIMIIFLALIVGVIVIALFLPLIQIITDLQ
jgi:type IV pilus assembly protein PilC